MPSLYVVNVQILRFFAALLVALAHVGVAIEERGQGFRMVYPLDWGLGVDVFFVISGFIMFYLMHDRFQVPGAPAKFLKRRLLRIAPLYWLCTTLMLASIVVAASVVNNNGLDPVHIGASYLFIPWPRANGEVFPLLSLGWTLNYEMLFYAVFAVALLMPLRRGMAFLAIAFAALYIAGRLAPSSWWLLRFWGDSIIGEFLLGIGLAAAFLRGVKLPLVLSAIFVVIGFAAAVVFYQTESYLVLPRFVTGGLPALFIAAGVILAPHAPVKRPYTWLARGGDASYALYLTHPFVSKIFAVAGARAGLPPLVNFPLTVAACIAVSVAVFLLFEKPVGAFLSRLVDARARPT